MNEQDLLMAGGGGEASCGVWKSPTWGCPITSASLLGRQCSMYLSTPSICSAAHMCTSTQPPTLHRQVSESQGTCHGNVDPFACPRVQIHGARHSMLSMSLTSP